MNPSEVEQHRFQRSRFETNLMKLIEEDKLWRSAFKCIFSQLSILIPNKETFGKEINRKNGFYIINSNQDWIVHVLTHLNKMSKNEFTIELDRVVENISYYRIELVDQSKQTELY